MNKTYSLLIVFLLSCTTLLAQSNVNNKTRQEEQSLFSTKGMSPSTAFLMLDLMSLEKNPSAISKEELIEKYSLIKKGNTLYVNSFLLEDAGFSTSTLEQMGVLLGSRSGKIHTGLVPLSQIANIAENTTIKYIDIGSKQHVYMDSARSQTNVDKVHQGVAPLAMPYTGDGVVVGVIDQGFDYTHPNFYDSTGTDNYRIKRVWDQNLGSGTAPFGYAYGTELKDKTSILNQAHGAYTNTSHGTHTAGTAAGAGGYRTSPYKGIAYKSDIVLVSSPFSTPAIADAIKYIQDYADSVKKPCVINMSFGGQFHAHDGTDLKSQYYDNLSDTGKLLIEAAGNSGDEKIYFGHKFFLSDSVASTFLSMPALNLSSGTSVFYATSDVSTNFSVRIKLLNRNTPFAEPDTSMPYKVSASINSFVTFTLFDNNNIPAFITMESGVDPLNNKPTIACQVENYSDRVVEIEITAHNTNVKMWSASNFVTFTDLGLSRFGPYYSGSNDHTVGNTSHGTVVVGAYTSKNQWVSLNNQPRYASSMAPVGEIASFSSKGPTADGRTKPDITAPGNVIVSSVSNYDTTLTPSSNLIEHSVTVDPKTWYFGAYQGTSMACPMVTGIVALWLEKNPKLTRQMALDMMKNTAIKDSYTGTIPANGSNTWGWGKINAFDALITVSIVDVPKEVKLNIYPNPASALVNIAFENHVEKSDVVLYDITGKIVSQHHFSNVSSSQIEQINTSDLINGIYLLKIINDNVTATYRLVKQ